MSSWYKKTARGPSSPIMTDPDSRMEDPYAYRPSVNSDQDGKGDKMTTPGDTSGGGLGGFGADYYTNYTNDTTAPLSRGPDKGYSATQDPSAQPGFGSDSDSFGMPNVENMNYDKGDYGGVSADATMGDGGEMGLVGLTDVINNKFKNKKDPVGVFNQSKGRKSIYDKVNEMAR
jgi:hypothetical protein